MPRVRLGVVLLLPEPVRTEIDGLRRACGDAALGLVPPHVTLVPPVNVRKEDVDDALAVVRAAASRGRAPLTLTVGPAATFHPVNPVLYLSVSGDTNRLRRVREAVLSGPLDRPPDWPFVPHVTIAGEAGPERLAAGVAALADYRATVVIPRVHLLREGDDRIWQPLADATLGGTGLVGRGGLPLEVSVSEVLDPEAVRFFADAWDRHLVTSHGPGAAGARPFAVTARREGRVVAVATGTIADELLLDRLVVDDDVRRQGIGAHVLAAVEHLAATHGCRRAVLIAQAAGPAEAFYRARGWRVVLALPAWRGGRDFVRMVRDLPSG